MPSKRQSITWTNFNQDVSWHCSLVTPYDIWHLGQHCCFPLNLPTYLPLLATLAKKVLSLLDEVIHGNGVRHGPKPRTQKLPTSTTTGQDILCNSPVNLVPVIATSWHNWWYCYPPLATSWGDRPMPEYLWCCTWSYSLRYLQQHACYAIWNEILH